MMRKICLIWLVAMLATVATADNQELMKALDEAIAQKDEYRKVKEQRIEFLKKKLLKEPGGLPAMQTLNLLYEEYHVFKFDSAMVYAERGAQLARACHNDYYVAVFDIHRAEIMAIGGLYSEAIANLDAIDSSQMDQQMLFDYNIAYFTAYSYWADYCHDGIYAPRYRAKADSCLDVAMRYADKGEQLYEFYQGEYNVYVQPDAKKARQHYTNVLKRIDPETRHYAMTANALAGNYRIAGDEQSYERYLILAAISDLKACTMENMALQALALYLFEKEDNHIERAQQYMSLAMENAKFYNNKLRILEISRTLPQIMDAHSNIVERQNRRLWAAVAIVSLLVLALLATAYFIRRQNSLLNKRRQQLHDNNLQLQTLNQQLADSNQRQVQLNQQLNQLNQQLIQTNTRRERLAYIYIDLCAKYIHKLSHYQTLVKRKIKANQAKELLQTISSTRISEEDAATFLHQFDKAFLELYPTFVLEFNKLLLPEAQIQLKSPTTLTTELRTFALMRLGVKSTTDIAALLFLSPQTIYNCRSVIRNKAINKDTFEQDVLQTS